MKEKIKKVVTTLYRLAICCVILIILGIITFLYSYVYQYEQCVKILGSDIC